MRVPRACATCGLQCSARGADAARSRHRATDVEGRKPPSFKDMRAACRLFGLNSDGKKAELYKRLRLHFAVYGNRAIRE